MAGTREIMTADTQCSYATDLFGVPSTNQNSTQMLTGLYKKLEPQLCKSYRRHVMYIPSDAPPPTITVTDKKKNKIKAVHMALDVVNELQRKKDTSAKAKMNGVKLDLRDVTNKAVDFTKNGSQSMPNLLGKPDS